MGRGQLAKERGLGSQEMAFQKLKLISGLEA